MVDELVYRRADERGDAKGGSSTWASSSTSEAM